MTATARGLFERRHPHHLPAVKDLLLVTLVVGLIVGFLVHAVRPIRPEAVAPTAVAVI